MNEQQIKEQLISAEIPAPVGVWDKLLTILDEDADDADLKNSLVQSMVTPSLNTWNAIEIELDDWEKDRVLAGLINQNAIAPPDLLWNKIDAELNATIEEQLAAKFKQVEVKTSITVWPEISNELKPEAKLIPIFRKYTPLYRIAAAAVFIGLVTWGVFQLLPNKSTRNLVTEIKTNPAITLEQSDKKTIQSEPIITVTEPKNEISKSNSNIIASNKPKKQNRIIVSKDVVMDHNKPIIPQTDFSETNYLIVLNENGDLIRVSKKLSTMGCAKNMEIPVDAITAIQGKDCDDRIKKLQQKLSTSVIGAILDPGTLTNSTDK